MPRNTTSPLCGTTTGPRPSHRLAVAVRPVCEALEGRTLFDGACPRTSDQVPFVAPPCPDQCPCGDAVVETDPNAGGEGQPSPASYAPVRYVDGTPIVASTDISSNGFGKTWSHTRTWSGLNNSSTNGNGWSVSGLPYLVLHATHNGTVVAAVDGGTSQRFFDLNGSTFAPRFYAQDKLEYTPPALDANNELRPGEFKLTDSSGNVTRYFDLPRTGSGTLDDTGGHAAQQATNANSGENFPNYFRFGAFKSFTDAAGNVTTAEYAEDDSNADLLRVVRSDSASGKAERFSYAYDTWTNDPVSLGGSARLLLSVTLERRADATSAWKSVRRAVYDYYKGDEVPPSGGIRHGRLGDLKLATIQDPIDPDAAEVQWSEVDTKYYRYQKFTGNSPLASTGPTNNPLTTGGPAPHTAVDGDNTVFSGLKSVFEGAAFDRLASNVSAFEAAPDEGAGSVRDYVDYYFKYERWADGDWSDAYHTYTRYRVTEEVAAGDGCSSCTSGQGNYKFEYTINSTVGSGFGGATFEPNVWRMRTIEYLPDTTLTDWTDNDRNIVYTNERGQVMLKVFEEDATGRRWATFHEYDEKGRLLLTARPSAVDSTVSLATMEAVANGSLVGKSGSTYSHLRPNAGLIETVDYNADGYVSEQAVKQGYSDENPDKQRSLTYTSHTANGITVRPVASETVYRNVDGGGGMTTTYAYTWHPGTVEMLTRTTTSPVVTAAQNGPGTTGDTRTQTFDKYGQLTRLVDGDGYATTMAYDFGTGAMTQHVADAGGMNLTTAYVVDGLGRTTKVTDPNGNVTYTVYNDTEHEVRTYRGWRQVGSSPSTYAATGAVEVTREYRPGGGTGQLYYTEMLTFTPPATPSATPTGTETIDASNIQSLSRQFYSNAGQILWSDDYFNLSGITSYTRPVSLSAGTDPAPVDLGSASNDTGAGGNYHRTAYSYDDRGRQNRVVSPTGTITRTDYDALGRAESTWVGTSNTAMTKVAENEYDNDNVGDGNLTKTTAYPGGTAAARVTGMYYDWRNTLVATKAGDDGTDDAQRQLLYCDLDNLGNQLFCWTYDADGVTVTSSGGVPQKPSATLLRGKTTTEFDEQGRPFRTSVFSVDNSGTVSPNALRTETWYDRRGNVVKTVAPNSPVTKTQFDAAGRAYQTFVSDGGGDTDWAHAGNVDGDVVLTQTLNDFDGNGNVIKTTTRDRFHDASATNELVSGNSRASYSAAYYDKADRLTATVDVGTNGGSAYTRPASAPGRTDPNVLVTGYDYLDGQRAVQATDPRNITTRTEADMLGRITRTVEAYGDGTPGPSAAEDRATLYTYDGAGHVLKLTADLPSGQADQTTQYEYDTALVAGSNIVSKDLLTRVSYPDKGTGAPGTAPSDRQLYTYNALGEMKTFRDQNGTEHAYGYDVLGRMLSDEVTTLGTGVDGTVRKLGTSYDTAGRPEKMTSYNAAGGFVNQVQRQYNGLRQLTAEYQELGGDVDTATSTQVEYAYDTTASSGILTKGSRLKSMTYPNGRVLSYNYNGSALDDSIGRLTSLSDPSGTLETYRYLGVGTVIDRHRPQAGTRLTYLQQGEGNGTAGDQYRGLDRFGRVAEQRWRNDFAAADTDRFGYGYDANFNPLYKENLVSAANSELYHADGSAGGYDNLNRLAEFQRGTLNGAKDAIPSQTRQQHWSLDALGNWGDTSGAVVTSVTTNGTPQGRAHNKRNHLTQVDGTSLAAPDSNGNMKGDELGHAFAYDAWNRAVAAGAATWAYDALGRKVKEGATDLYYSDQWQVLEERVNGAAVKAQNVWGLGYVDDLVLRDRDLDTSADGTLDATFSPGGAEGDGRTLLDFHGDVDLIRAVAVQADGKILATGRSVDASGVGRLVVSRFNADGSLDTAFGNNGTFTLNVANADGWGVEVLQAPDGKVLVGGYAAGPSYDWVVVRLTASGALDSTFGSNGVATLDWHGHDDILREILVQPDGKVVAVGHYSELATLRQVPAVARFTAGGALDTTFDSDGKKAIEPFGSSTEGTLFSVALAPGSTDGKLTIAGHASVGTAHTDILLARLTSAGALDASFDGDGMATTDWNGAGGTDHALDVAIQPDGKAVVAAYAVNQFGVARYTAAGSLDGTFGTGGKTVAGLGAGSEAADVVVLTDGKVLAGGHTGSDFALVRLTSAGAMDTTFDTDGVVTTDFAGRADQAYAMAMLPDGNVVLGGRSWNGGNADFALAKYKMPQQNGGLEERLYAQHDANYNVTSLTDVYGAVKQRFVYDPYGAATVLSGTWTGTADAYDWRYRHQGGRYDAGSNVLEFRHRIYSPTLGRWMQQDPLGYVDGMNLLNYLHSNPIARRDPLGLDDDSLVAEMAEFSGRTRGYKDGSRAPLLAFGRCQRSIRDDSLLGRLANAIGSHGYIMTTADRSGFGVTNPKAKKGDLPAPDAPNAGEDVECKICDAVAKPLKYGKAAGTLATKATADQIRDCVKNSPLGRDYGTVRYNCNDWADDALDNCGIECFEPTYWERDRHKALMGHKK